MPENSHASTVCNECWLPLIDQEPQIDTCPVPGYGEMSVAHAVVYESTIKTLAYKLKYDNDRLIAMDLGKLLLKAVGTLNAEYNFSPAPVLVPIPLSFWRKVKRGFNQAEMLAAQISKHSDLKLQPGLLSRKRNTKAQHDLSKEARRVNLKNAFTANPKSTPAVLLVDDIHTSGATLAEAAQTLHEAGVTSLSAVTVARALLIEPRINK